MTTDVSGLRPLFFIKSSGFLFANRPVHNILPLSVPLTPTLSRKGRGSYNFPLVFLLEKGDVEDAIKTRVETLSEV